MTNNKKGFTLIEILIVISVIGILASIVLVNLGGFRSRGRDARRISDLRTIQNALELYYANNGEYPASGQLYADVEAMPGIGKLPTDLRTGNPPYGYGVSTGGAGDPAAGQGYVLQAKLEDKNVVLDNDVDDATYGVECVDGTDNWNYCIKF